MQSDLSKPYVDDEQLGLPSDYPVPPKNDNSLFYIQRNQNKNTIVYEVNRNMDGTPQTDFPINIFWIKYTEGGVQGELNYIQNKLAYGYKASMIDYHTFEFKFVSYDALQLFIGQAEDKKYQVCCNISGQMSVLSNIYVYVEDFGVFPDPKYIELFGTQLKTGAALYEKIYL